VANSGTPGAAASGAEGMPTNLVVPAGAGPAAVPPHCKHQQGIAGEPATPKPGAFATRGSRGLVQPALKVRGAEYLRFIYGPEYTLPGKLERLRERGLIGKRGLVLREFALGLEARHRFTDGEPLRRVHECVFGVLALLVVIVAGHSPEQIGEGDRVSPYVR
jgi:hypothetical protein